ncbi:MAG: hypothetical protein V4636_18755 [Pseudomonadota bacterium]
MSCEWDIPFPFSECDFSTSPKIEDLPAGAAAGALAVICAAPIVFQTLVDTEQAAVPWTLSILGSEGATLAGPDAATVKIYQTRAGVFNLARMPRTFHEQLVTRQRNEPLQNFVARTDFLARLRHFEGPLEAVLCVCKSWQRHQNTNEILMRGDSDELQALWSAIALTDAAIGDMRCRLESFADIEKTASSPMGRAHDGTQHIRTHKRVDTQTDPRRETGSNEPGPDRHSGQFMPPTAELNRRPKVFQTSAQETRSNLVSQPVRPKPVPVLRKSSHGGRAKSEPSKKLVNAWTAIDAIRRLWSSSKCSDHLIGDFLGMGPTQVAAIFGKRTSIPPPQASHLKQRADMDLDGMVAAIKQGKSVYHFPQHAEMLAPLRTLIAMDNKQRESFRKRFHSE